MADPRPDRTPADDEVDEAEGTPRWVYAFGILIAALLIGFAVLHLLGGGFPTHTFP